ncbi:hypothetical protein [Elizabethkingia ursingii]|uniref:hypothetical protein n=1 Tax=Elizabethkingia ursingii TaxID=1756150 RepID=UPI000750723C|nr:hypothetical protein [Elizabethkingia ursingii]KUY31545.1 hypothetical protein ATB96_09790 [Elizabethkingia ursingii]
MNKKLLFTYVWGFLLILLFHGCRTNDEVVKSERQIQGAEYSSKTLWNEDEKYIKNVIKIYDQYKETVSKSTQIKGEPFWDYAMTMGHFNESYLEVPVINQEKVVQILRVIRKGSKVYFGSNSEEKTSIDFFQQFIFGKYATIKGEEEHKGKFQNTGNGALADGQYICTTRKISMWYPDDNNNPDGSGHWETSYESRCLWVEQEKTDIIVPCVGPGCDGAGNPGGGSPGFPYPEPIEDSCIKLKMQANDEKFKEKVALIDNDKVLGYDHEMGYAAGYPPENTGITTTQYPPMDNKLGTTNVKLPDGDTYFGFMHTHNNFDSNGNSPIKIFSPADIVTFLTSCVRSADERGSVSDAYAMVITSEGNYILKYSGDGSYNIGPNQIKNWEKQYIKTMTEIISQESFNQGDIERTFAQFLKDTVKVDGLEVYKSEKNTGSTSKINIDGTKNPC